MARLFDDGSSQALSYSSALVAVRPLTMACWFYTDTVAITETLMAIFKDDEAGFDGFALDVSGTETGDPVRAWAQILSGAIDIAKTTLGPSVNTWHHACGIFSATATTVYIDAGNSGTDGATAAPDAPNETCIGRRYYAGYSAYWSGRIAEATIWNVALTAAEVAELATGIRPIFVRPQSIVAYWPLVRDQDYDLVGGYDMTPINSPTVSAHAPIAYGAPLIGTIAPAAGAIVSLAAEILAESVTPDDPVLAVARAMSAAILAGSVTPNDVTLAIARGMVATAHAASLTADDPVLAVLRAMTATGFARTASPDDVVLALSLPLSATLLAASTTPDDVTLAFLVTLAANLLATSTTPDDVQLAVLRGMASTSAAISTTPDDAVLAITRAFAATLRAQSATPDDVTLLLAILLGLMYADFAGRGPGAICEGTTSGAISSGRDPGSEVTGKGA